MKNRPSISKTKTGSVKQLGRTKISTSIRIKKKEVISPQKHSESKRSQERRCIRPLSDKKEMISPQKTLSVSKRCQEHRRKTMDILMIDKKLDLKEVISLQKTLFVWRRSQERRWKTRGRRGESEETTEWIIIITHATLVLVVYDILRGTAVLLLEAPL